MGRFPVDVHHILQKHSFKQLAACFALAPLLWNVHPELVNESFCNPQTFLVASPVFRKVDSLSEEESTYHTKIARVQQGLEGKVLRSQATERKQWAILKSSDGKYSYILYSSRSINCAKSKKSTVSEVYWRLKSADISTVVSLQSYPHVDRIIWRLLYHIYNHSNVKVK